ncbi:MAG: multidrug effflux MFS transporter [Pseudomonadota bacterium]
MAFLNRRSAPNIITLVLVAGLGAASLNIFLPSMPGIAAHFGVPYATVQLLVSAYLAGTAIMQIIIGPLSDRYGRRPVLLACFGVFMLGTAICATADSFAMLMFGRMVQTVIVSGFALSRAIVRDMVGTEEAASMIGYVTMGMTLVPMIMPIVGGYLEEWFGWASTFQFLFLTAAMVLAVVWFDLGETNHTKSGSFSAQFKAYPELLRSRRFWGYTATAAFASGAFFAFLGGGPYVATVILGMEPSDVGKSFLFIALGYMSGNFISGRYAKRVGITPMMFVGSVVACFGLLLSLALFLVGFSHPMTFFGPIFFVGFGNGMTLPSANAGMVSVRPHLAGSASGLGGASMIGGGAALSVIAGLLLNPESGVYPLLLVMLASCVCGVLATLYVRYVDAQVAREAAQKKVAEATL